MFLDDVSWWVAMETSGCRVPLSRRLCIGSILQSLFRKGLEEFVQVAERGCTSRDFTVRCAVGKTFLVKEIVNNKISPQTVFSPQGTLHHFCIPSNVCIISLKFINMLSWDSWHRVGPHLQCTIPGTWKSFSDVNPWNRGKTNSLRSFPVFSVRRRKW